MTSKPRKVKFTYGRDPLNLKIPNINFSLDCVTDTKNTTEKARKKWKSQRITRGFDDTELWNLGITIARFVKPRLEEFIKIAHGYPPTFKSFEHFQKYVEELIWVLGEIEDDSYYKEHYSDPEYKERYEAAFKELSQLFTLWD